MNGRRLGVFVWSWLLAFMPRAQHVIELGTGTFAVLGLHEPIDSVVLAFDPLAPIGTVYKGVPEQPVPAYLSGPTDRILHNFLSGGEPAEGGPGLVIKVNMLHLSEHTVKGTGRASCALHLEVLRREGPATWVRVYAHGTNALWRGVGVTGAHDRTLASAFTECLAGYVAARDAERLESVVMGPTGLQVVPEGSALLAALAAIPRRGLYHTYMDALRNSPDSITPFVLERRDPVEMPRSMRMKGDTASELRKALWGCSDGVRRYVNVDGQFLELSRDAAALRTRVRFSEVDPEMAVMGAVMFGALGGAFGAAASLRERSVPVRVELLTGRLVGDPERWSEVPVPTDDVRRAEVFFVHSRNGRQEAPIRLQVPGREGSVHMAKGQYHTMLLEPRHEDLIVKAQVGNMAPVDVPVNANELAHQVFLLKADKRGAIKVSRLNWEMSQAILNNLHDEDRVP
ncbi:MAG: hypothetical protein KA175_14865 [Flavobacteriales bacterium]|nr:hypothetical protein [Flavobacteriales bacterium]MBP6698900.1 hypothetical protein [Flavobacteriales bacterium]